jgi:flagellar biosynthetic protein FliQ
MFLDQAVALARQTLEIAAWLSAPILLIAIIVGILTSVVQVMTSIQDMTVGTVPRLAAVGIILVVLMPWFLHRLMTFTLQLLTDFHPFLG